MTKISEAYRALLKAIKSAFKNDQEAISKATTCARSQFLNPSGPPMNLGNTSEEEKIRIAYNMADFLKDGVVQGKLASGTTSVYSFSLQAKHRIDTPSSRGPCRVRCSDCNCTRH
jgi:hypothetical protein